MTREEWYKQLFEGLGNSRFRSSFHLKQKDIDYIHEKGLDTIRKHAKDFIAKREAPAYIHNDGKQTPIKLAQGTPAISKWLGRNARDPFISYPASTFSSRCCKPWTQVYIFSGKRIFYRQRQDR